MARKASISGFPELLPQERMLELKILDILRKNFELHGFCSLETRSVEPKESLTNNGDIDKEIYLLQRVQQEANNSTKNKQLGLHFDLTLPFSRYITENAGHLEFPFRRYQIQKVWRGERPQEGRFREFTQADIDIISENTLPAIHDIEIVLTILEALQELPIPPVNLRINNRKLAEGFYQAIGIDNTLQVLQAIDKLEKIGFQKVYEMLQAQVGLSSQQADAALKLATIKTADTSFIKEIAKLNVSSELMDQGIAELENLIETLQKIANIGESKISVDLSIARGLDYYTGNVYETTLIGHESLGSICSGGRYDNLAKSGNKKYPGVGISLGVTRLISRILGKNLYQLETASPVTVYIVLNEDNSWIQAQQVAKKLRSRGINVEVSVNADKFTKQLRYAQRRNIPFVWFIQLDGSYEVRNMEQGTQKTVNIDSWTP